ncbi:unnamed protein product, partial [Closterium sp. Naga37s-1]
MQLLRPSPNHDRLEVVQSTLDVLERIQQPVAFVAVVGPYHGYAFVVIRSLSKL